jgi:hypothetical protein
VSTLLGHQQVVKHEYVTCHWTALLTWLHISDISNSLFALYYHLPNVSFKMHYYFTIKLKLLNKIKLKVNLTLEFNVQIVH